MLAVRKIGRGIGNIEVQEVPEPQASNLHRVPDELDLESAALTEPLACTVHGVLETATVNAGDNVVITGPGTIGLFNSRLG